MLGNVVACFKLCSKFGHQGFRVVDKVRGILKNQLSASSLSVVGEDLAQHLVFRCVETHLGGETHLVTKWVSLRDLQGDGCIERPVVSQFICGFLRACRSWQINTLDRVLLSLRVAFKHVRLWFFGSELSLSQLSLYIFIFLSKN